MEITPLTIYLWQLADNVKAAGALACALITIGAIIHLVWGGMTLDSCPNEEQTERARSALKIGRRLIIALAALLSLSCLLPSSNTIAMMVVIPKIADSKVIQQDVPDLYNTAVEALKDQLKKK